MLPNNYVKSYILLTPLIDYESLNIDKTTFNTMLGSFEKLLNDKCHDEPDEDTFIKASLFETYHAYLQGMAGYLRDVGLCHSAMFDSMMSCFAPCIPDQTLVKEAFPYSWEEVRHAHHHIYNSQQDKPKPDDELLARVRQAGEQLVALAKIASYRLRCFGIAFSRDFAEDDEQFAEKVLQTIRSLGIHEDMAAYLSGDVPLDDIVA